MLITILARLSTGIFIGYLLAMLILDYIDKGHNVATYVYLFLMVFVYFIFKYEMKTNKD